MYVHQYWGICGYVKHKPKIIENGIIIKEPTNASRKQQDLLMHFWIYPNMFQQVTSIIRGL
jgi:hypothetical protein